MLYITQKWKGLITCDMETRLVSKCLYFKSLIMTAYSLFITVYMSVMVVICTNYKSPEYDVLNLMPNYNFSSFERIFWNLRYLNFIGLVQIIMSFHIDDDKYNHNAMALDSFHPRSRYQRASVYGNMKDNVMNQIKFFTKKLTVINVAVNVILLTTSYAHYSWFGFSVLLVQTLNDYFFISDFCHEKMTVMVENKSTADI